MDKLVHFLCGLVITLVVGLFTLPLIGFIVAVLAGVGKELYDWKKKKQKFNVLDLLMTVYGGAFGLIVLYFADYVNSLLC